MMSNSPYTRSSIALATLEFISPMIRESLLDESEFRKDYSLKKESLLSFGNSNVSLLRTEIFDAVRRVLAGVNDVDLTDTDGQVWKLRNEAEPEQQPKLVIISEHQRQELPDFAALSPETAIRLRSLELAAFDVNLPTSERNSWQNILKERALDDVEVELYLRDIRETPVYVVGKIRGEILKGKGSVSSLVPLSRRYYERLVGKFDKSPSIADYTSNVGRGHFEQLSKWKPFEGFLLGLVLSAHSSLTAEISVENLETAELDRAFNYVENHGDVLSKLGAIEIGLRILSKNPSIETVLVRLTKQIMDDDVKGPTSGFALLSSLFVLVDGELARSRLMHTEPPFYRRLAALAHAALLCRLLVSSRMATNKVCEWALEYRLQQYFLQTYADMRTEPRWIPSLAEGDQLKAEFCGRVRIAANNCCANAKCSRLYELILGKEGTSSLSSTEFPTQYLPGLLVGAETSQIVLPDELSKTIKDQLNTRVVQPSSFFTLVNSALTFRIETDIADLAANALRRSKYRLSNIQDQFQLLTTLTGLATVAAVTRNHALADELRVTSRHYRHDPQFCLSIIEEMFVCLGAAASRSDLTDWRDFIGEWLTELSFTDLKREEAVSFNSHLKYLCCVQPDLWISCGKADAALMAYIGF